MYSTNKSKLCNRQILIIKLITNNDVNVTSENNIPEIFLSIGSLTHHGVLGSYCWNKICITKTMPSDIDLEKNITKMKIQKGNTIDIKINNYTYPEKFHLTVFSKGNSIAVDEDVQNQFKANLQEGPYIVNIMAAWMYKGDVSYLFPIEIVN